MWECGNVHCTTTNAYDEEYNCGNVHCTTTNAYDEEYNCGNVHCTTTNAYDEEYNCGNVHCTTTNAYDEEYNCEDIDFIAPDSNKDEEKHFFWNEPEQKQREDKENILLIKLKTQIPEYCEMGSQFCTKTATLIHTIYAT